MIEEKGSANIKSNKTILGTMVIFIPIRIYAGARGSVVG
jgi:hypothetical protein